MLQIKEADFEKIVGDMGYDVFYYEQDEDPNSKVYDSTKVLELARSFEIFYILSADGYYLFYPTENDMKLLRKVAQEQFRER